MILEKKNVVIYTIQLDADKVKDAEETSWLICDLFKEEFQKAGLTKLAELMHKGGFSYKVTESNPYYTEYEVSIRTRLTIL